MAPRAGFLRTGLLRDVLPHADFVVSIILADAEINVYGVLFICPGVLPVASIFQEK